MLIVNDDYDVEKYFPSKELQVKSRSRVRFYPMTSSHSCYFSAITSLKMSTVVLTRAPW